jgi:hypothetical protein
MTTYNRRARRADFYSTTGRKDAVVYRAYDAEGRLLYVGCTVDFKARMKAHEGQAHNTSPWWPYAVHIERDAPRPFSVARDNEARAIREESPWFNGREQDQVQRWRGVFHRAFAAAIPPCGDGYAHLWFDHEDDGSCGRTREDHDRAERIATAAANAAHGVCRDVSYRHQQYRIAAGLEQASA